MALHDFQTFDTTEELFAVLDRNRQAADGACTPAQMALKPGDYYVRFLPEDDLVVYGEIIDPVASDQEYGADADELAYLKELYSAPHMQGIRFGRHYSVMCVEGELGDMHVVTAHVRLSLEAFNWFKEREFPSDKAVVREGLALHHFEWLAGRP